MAASYIGRSDLPRGLRNNNQGNLRSGDDWQGMVGTDDSSFVIFKDISWGLRALATDLTNKIGRGVNTIRSIVSVYAPASDNNNVAAYINSVASDTGNDPDEPLGVDKQTIHDLVRAFMNHELGGSYSDMVTDQDIDHGIGMMNANLVTLIEASGIAIDAAVATATGQPPGATGPGNLVIGLAAAGVLIWLFTRKN